MARIIIFGIQDFAELAHYYLVNDSEHEVVAFCVHSAYLPAERKFKNLPVVAFEKVEELYPPGEYSFFAPMAPKKMNALRESVYNEIKTKGYSLISYVSSKATVLTSKIGDNCFILEDNTIQPFVEIGNDVILWSGNHIGHHSIIKDHAFFTSHVVLSGHCVVGTYCFFGVNATIRDGVYLGEGTLVAMGSNLTSKKTEAWSIYKGNPALKSDVSSKDINF
jgi:sugar O-acyltransferase (sialic acid O-acetyltransferase NeuD family)